MTTQNQNRFLFFVWPRRRATCEKTGM